MDVNEVHVVNCSDGSGPWCVSIESIRVKYCDEILQPPLHVSAYTVFPFTHKNVRKFTAKSSDLRT